VARLALNLQSIGVAHQDDFRIETRWTRPNGLPAAVKQSGARAHFEAKEWRIAEPIWTTLQLVERLNAATGESERQAARGAAPGDRGRGPFSDQARWLHRTASAQLRCGILA
jgi:hypothetical protein